MGACIAEPNPSLGIHELLTVTLGCPFMLCAMKEAKVLADKPLIHILRVVAVETLEGNQDEPNGLQGRDGRGRAVRRHCRECREYREWKDTL